MESRMKEMDENLQSRHRRRSAVELACAECQVTFSTRTNLNRHIRKRHPGRVKCEICEDEVETNIESHLQEVHDVVLKTVKLIFKSEIHFQLWKVEEEKRTGAQYVSTSGTKKTASCVAKRYFVCRRSGKFHSRIPDQNRKKRRASVRCGVKCPAKMTLTVDPAGSYIVDYQETHCGHDREVPKLQDDSADGELLGFLETIWKLRNLPRWKRIEDRVHMHFDRKQAVILVSEVAVIPSDIVRPCFLSTILFYESSPPSVYVRGVEVSPDSLGCGDLSTDVGCFKLILTVLTSPKCPGIVDQSEVVLEGVPGYIDTANRWRHDNCLLFSPEGKICASCGSYKVMLIDVD